MLAVDAGWDLFRSLQHQHRFYAIFFAFADMGYQFCCYYEYVAVRLAQVQFESEASKDEQSLLEDGAVLLVVAGVVLDHVRFNAPSLERRLQYPL